MSSRRWARPLRLHLSIVIVTLLVAISAPLMWLTYQHGRAAAITAGENQMRDLGLRVIDRYRNVFGDGYSAVSMASVLPELLSPPPGDIGSKRDFLLKALQSSPFIDGIYAGYPSGSFVHAVNVAANPNWREALSAPGGTVYAMRTIEKDGSGALSTWRFLDGGGNLLLERADRDDTFDPRRRPWYRAAVAAAGQVSVGPYATATTKSLSLTLAMPSAKDPHVVVGADVLLETISHLLNRNAVSANARGYVFDSDKRLMVHSDPVLMERILDTLSNTPRGGDAASLTGDPAIEPIQALLQGGEASKGGTMGFNVGGAPYLAVVAPVEFSGLLKGNTVVIAAPLEDFVGPSNRLLTKTLLIAAALLIAGILAALMVARLVSNALFSLAGEARRIGDLKLEKREPTHSLIAEINTLSRALGAARDAIYNFSLYVPRELVRKIIDSGQGADAAARQDVTLLFTDIRDFTTISEQHSPEAVVEMLSAYFQRMNDVVEQHNGTIIQYLGDSIFGMWNAPVADPEHVENACRGALALKTAIDALNAENRAAGRPEFITRFGLHTGPAVVGSVGAQSRRQYTAMGDTVNVASRLEGMNKQFGTSILASRAVYEAAGKAFRFRPLGLAQAKGRLEEIEVFELLGADA
ncbi:adenylate/guanylate cyclase domain-containing protein [Rhizobium sp. RAF56]|jgi:adenylate cyclase|uniref:adenylate/guanylate cyclase domain-containing protein n=1 Tax=Rhizobium sp. RAF56 TaxID=3233062 RepID=UPI003F9A3EB6